MANEFRAAGDGLYDAEIEDFSGYLEKLRKQSRAEDLLPARVPGKEFWLMSGDRVIGRSKLRHRLNPALEREGGHIGYDICLSERRKGFGTLILRLTLEKAKDLGLSRVLLTCDADNIGSAKIIENNGGVLSGRDISEKSGKPILRFWIEIQSD